MLYGPTLLQHVPEDTTALLIDLCSGTLGREPTKSTADKSQPTNGTTDSGQTVLSYIGYNRVAGMFTGEPAKMPEKNAEIKTNGDRSLSKSTGSKSATAREGSRLSASDTKPTITAEPSYIPPSPRQYFAHFVDHRDLFIEFLESVALLLWDQKVDATKVSTSPNAAAPPAYSIEPSSTTDPAEKTDQRAVWNTLLELYLSNTAASLDSVQELARGKALGLLASDLPYDTMHALLLCSINGFTEGSVRIWERMGMYEDVLRFYMDTPYASPDREAHGNKVIEALDLYGAEHPNLYPLVLRWITGSSEVLERHGKELPRILAEIDERRILPPLTVVQILSRNGVASVGNVKEWLRGKVAETKQDIESVRSSSVCLGNLLTL